MIRWRPCLVTAVVAVFLLPYLQCVDRATPAEQVWLDRVIDHLRCIHSDDPAVQSRLEYTIGRYSRIGPFGVRFQPSLGIAHNVPWVPGITVDPEALRLLPDRRGPDPLPRAQHDYTPYLGHRHFQ